MEATIAIALGSTLIAGAGLLIAAKNSQRVDTALELSASTLAFNELSRRVTLLEDENKKLREEVAKCNSEKADLLERLVRALAGKDSKLP